MSTLKDIKQLLELAYKDDEIFGFSDIFREQFLNQVHHLGGQIATELGVSLEQAQTLPLETELGEKAEEQFFILQLLYYLQYPESKNQSKLKLMR